MIDIHDEHLELACDNCDCGCKCQCGGENVTLCVVDAEIRGRYDFPQDHPELLKLKAAFESHGLTRSVIAAGGVRAFMRGDAPEFQVVVTEEGPLGRWPTEHYRLSVGVWWKGIPLFARFHHIYDSGYLGLVMHVCAPDPAERRFDFNEIPTRTPITDEAIERRRMQLIERAAQEAVWAATA